MKLGFLKPKAYDIELVGSEKYYEPYIVVGGKYSLDYCRKHDFKLEVKKKAREVYIAGKKFEVLASRSGKNFKQVIQFEGQEYAHFESESFFVFDRLRREISPKSFSFAPYETRLEGEPDVSLNLRKVRVSIDEVIELVRSRIAKRPPDLAEIIREVFEITENSIVYRPFFEFTYHNIKTNNYATLRVDGVSGEKVLCKFENEHINMFLSNSNLETVSDFGKIKANVFLDSYKEGGSDKDSNQSDEKPKASSKVYEDQAQEVPISDEKITLNFKGNVVGEIFSVGDDVTAVVGDLEIYSGTTVNDTLVVKGKLKIGDNCNLLRKVKALGDVTIGIATIVKGDIVSGGNVVIGSKSVVVGRVRAAGRIRISEKVTVGKEIDPYLDRLQDTFDLETIVDTEKEEALV
ncbi:MAG: hypothetical protein ACXAB4_05175 [Candidatus Hodarchaeales archaeon]